MDLLSARWQMGMSLAFHILFAVVGMAMPLFMVVAEGRFLRSKNPALLTLAKKWSAGTAIIFAVGAVSGTVLSFELGLLWPNFMRHAGPIVGAPFSLEGFAFFLEAIFIGIYLYGWNKITPRAHLASGIMVALSGLASGIFVMSVNTWMNTPAGFQVQGGELVRLDLFEAFFNPGFVRNALHMVLAAYVSVAFVVLGIHCWALLKTPDSVFHREAAGCAMWVALVTIPPMLLSGDFVAKQAAKFQPVKFAAMESLFVTQERAPFTIGGWPDMEQRQVHGEISIPGLLSFLAHYDINERVIGLNDFPSDEWPYVPLVHLCFQIMVGCGLIMAAVVAYAIYLLWRKKDPLRQRQFLKAAILASPLGLIALQTGWGVTEFGRQPWIIHGFLRTADALTPMPGLIIPFILFTVLYLILGIVVLLTLRAHVFHSLNDETMDDLHRASSADS
jgi:cytochrome d ubiquinol oxidase subunit I